MAEIIENEKGFKIIKLSLSEINKAFGGYGICDDCNNASFDHYYIAALNETYCPTCYEAFCKRARWYPEDSKIENANFEDANQRLNL
jgi:hypothetical protein